MKCRHTVLQLKNINETVQKPYRVHKRKLDLKIEVYQEMSYLCFTGKENRQIYFISTALEQST